jgi:hypothetical protein
MAPVAAPAIAPIPVPFSRVVSGCPEHPTSTSAIRAAISIAVPLFATGFIWRFSLAR